MTELAYTALCIAVFDLFITGIACAPGWLEREQLRRMERWNRN